MDECVAESSGGGLRLPPHLKRHTAPAHTAGRFAVRRLDGPPAERANHGTAAGAQVGPMPNRSSRSRR